MIKIMWKGKVGYGDIISPICYAHNVSNKLNEHVQLAFHWAGDALEKIDPSDPETLWERANYIDSLCEPTRAGVTVIHKFKNPIDFNHTSYDWDVVGHDYYHNYWFPRDQKQSSDHKTIVVNSTQGNTVTLKQYGKSWKDPVADQWPYIVDLLSRSFDVVVVDYRTPIRDLCEMLRTAAGFVGYHGTAAWPAKFMHIPSIIFSDGGNLTRCAFPYTRVYTANDDITSSLRDIEYQFDEIRADIKTFTQGYSSYMPSEKFQLHLCYDND